MTAVAPAPTTPWSAGRLRGGGAATLLFGRMFEDPAIELEAFGQRRSVLAIASAGDVPMALAAAGHHVTAVDINPAQIDYASARLAGGPPRAGQADRVMAAGRAALRPAGWSRRRLEALRAMDDRDEQVAEWRRLTSGASGAALRALLAPAALKLGYRGAFARPAATLRRQVPDRIERGMALHPNATNPWAGLLLTGRWPDDEPDPAWRNGTIDLAVADVAAHLEEVRAGTYDAFTLSNVLDGTPDEYGRRLFEALRHAGRPGAVVVLRTLLAPASPAEAEAATRDRALLWGGIRITTVEQL
jgi:hypothetical protein